MPVTSLFLESNFPDFVSQIPYSGIAGNAAITTVASNIYDRAIKLVSFRLEAVAAGEGTKSRTIDRTSAA